MIRTILFASLLSPVIALAGDTTGDVKYTLIAPFGSLTGSVTLTDYLTGAFTTLIGVAGVLAVIMLVICGIQLMASGSVSGKSAAKECIWNAIFGVLLALGSWIILNTINPLLLRNDARLAVAVPAAPAGAEIGSGGGSGGSGGGSGGSEPSNPTTAGCHFKIKDLTTNVTKFESFPNDDETCIQCNAVRRNFQTYPDKYEILSECYYIKEGTTGGSAGPTPPPGDTSGTLMDGVKCTGQPANLCEAYPMDGGCENSSCSQFFSMVKRTANGSVSPAMLMSLIVKESSCGINARSSSAGACGPTQLKPDTANANKSGCGVTETITCGWLNNKANWEKALCISVKYLNANAGSGCGNSIIGMAAGYNGGYGNATCGVSANCTTQTSCRGGSVRKWECPYEDNAHTQCNVGYRETRNYGPKVLYCTQYYQKKGF